jgi:hypothetical protein
MGISNKLLSLIFIILVCSSIVYGYSFFENEPEAKCNDNICQISNMILEQII